MKIREFTEEGNQQFHLLYKRIKESVLNYNKDIEKGYTPNLKKKMKELVADPNLSIDIGGTVELKIPSSDSQFLFGKYIDEVLKEHNELKIFNNEKLWNWLSAYFFDIIFHKKAKGISEHRYLLSDSWFTKYRHLVRTPWYMHKIYNESSKLFLHGATYFGGNYMEQWISHRINEKFTKAADIAFDLYYDKKNDEPKSGYSHKFISKKVTGSKKRVKTLVPGSLGRLIDKLNQYNEIYNIWEMDRKEIIQLLPKEFDELKEH